ncbi:MAG: FAD-dependent oxidoreductase [Ignavibacteriales bacterium]|nr:FAD-dependent oxidoreductase [Ignavibacteriales bacterium]
MKIKKYDYIIYSASLAGVVFAIEKIKQDKKVLLLNQVGFPGGSITENLNIEQNIPSEINSEIIKIILLGIKNHCQGILYQKNSQVILNPEAIKFILQKVLTEKGVDLLFHIRFNKIKKQENTFSVSLIGREGELHFECDNLIDASEEFILSDLSKAVERELLFRRYNLLTSFMKNEDVLNKDYIIGKIKLNDGRYWLSLKIEEKNELLYEHESHKIVEELSYELFKNECRTQLLPIATQSLYRIEQKNELPNFYILHKELVAKYNRHKLIELTDNLNFKE